MSRTTIYLALLTVFLLVIAACTTGADDDDQADVEPTPTEIVDNDTDNGDEAPVDDAATDEETAPNDEEVDDVVSQLEEYERDEPIEPDQLTLFAESGEQIGWPRNYFWSDPEEIIAMEIQGHFVPLHEEPLQVEPGETLTMEAEQEDLVPNEISIEVYTREDNFEESVGTRDGESDAFYPHTDPIHTEEIDAKAPEWTIDLDEGEYFLLVDTVWPTPDGWPQRRTVQYAFWISVG